MTSKCLAEKTLGSIFCFSPASFPFFMDLVLTDKLRVSRSHFQPRLSTCSPISGHIKFNSVILWFSVSAGPACRALSGPAHLVLIQSFVFLCTVIGLYRNIHSSHGTTFIPLSIRGCRAGKGSPQRPSPSSTSTQHKQPDNVVLPAILSYYCLPTQIYHLPLPLKSVKITSTLRAWFFIILYF